MMRSPNNNATETLGIAVNRLLDLLQTSSQAYEEVFTICKDIEVKHALRETIRERQSLVTDLESEMLTYAIKIDKRTNAVTYDAYSHRKDNQEDNIKTIDQKIIQQCEEILSGYMLPESLKSQLEGTKKQLRVQAEAL